MVTPDKQDTRVVHYLLTYFAIQPHRQSAIMQTNTHKERERYINDVCTSVLQYMMYLLEKSSSGLSDF